MALSFNTPSGLVDLPDAVLAAGKMAAGYLLLPINRNTQFGATIPEVFYGEYKHGDTVPLPVSTVDGYNYQRDELVYVWEQRSTLDYATHMAGAAGELILCTPWVNPVDGVVQVLTAYYVQGGAQWNTNDGIIAVWTFGIRRRGNLSLTAPPTFTDIGDAVFNQDVALKTTNLVNLSRNAKLAAVRLEIFSKSDTLDAKGFPAGYSNGQTVPLPTSPVDGYVYSRSELTYLPFWIYTGKSNRSGSTGPGRIRFLGISVNASTGLVSTQVNYWNGSTETVTYDGIVGVVIVACRAIGTMAAQAAAFTEVADETLMAGKVCGDTPMKAVNKNAKFSILRPEAFIGSYTNGQQVPLPTSPVDGYSYARAELRYLFALQASTVTGAKGAIQVLIHGVDPATGVISTRLDYNNNGQNRQQTTEGQLRVLTLAFRSHETADLETTPTPPEPPSAPAPPTWVDFSGGDGLFYFELSVPDDLRELTFHQVQLAADAAFTTSLTTVGLGRALEKNIRLPRVTRYARARSRFFAGDWSAWAVYGAPTAVASGHPLDDASPGSFDPADPRLGSGVRQDDGSGNPRHIFRYDDPTHTLDLVIDSAARKARTAAHSTYRPLSNPLTATDAGASATVNVAAFTLRVAGQADVNYSLGSISSLAFNTLYFIYCDDPTFQGGTQTYEATVTKENALSGAGRIFIGSIYTPADGAAATTGNNDGGAGAQTGFSFPLSPSSYAVEFSDFSPTNPTRFFDGDPNSYAGVAGNGPASDYQQLDVFGFSTVGLARKSATLRVTTEVTKSGTAGTATLSYSLNGGDTWTQIYSVTNATRAKQTDSVVLSASQSLGAVRVRAYCIGSVNASTITIRGYEIWIDVEG